MEAREGWADINVSPRVSGWEIRDLFWRDDRLMAVTVRYERDRRDKANSAG